MNEKIKYETFERALICELQERLGEEYILEKHEKEEVNQEPGKRIIVHKKQEQVSMALHTKGLYEKFIGGDICMEEIVDDLLEVIQGDNNESGRNLAWEFRKLIMNMKSVHSHIYPWLVNSQKNEKLLETVPYVKFTEDLAIIFVFRIMQREEDSATVRIDNEMQYILGMNTEALLRISRENLLKDKYSCVPIEEILDGIIRDQKEEMDVQMEDIPTVSNLYVFSNEIHQFAAVGIIHENLRKAIVETVHGDAYILPSSLHELLILPTSEGTSACTLRNLVHSVNQNILEQREYLSDNIYLLHSDTLEVDLLQ